MRTIIFLSAAFLLGCAAEWIFVLENGAPKLLYRRGDRVF